VDINVEGSLMLQLGNNFSLPVYETLSLSQSNYDSTYNANARNMNLSDLLLCPRITQSEINGIKVQFLDFNSQLLWCGVYQDQPTYSACVATQNFSVYYEAYHNFTQANLYFYRFIIALQNLDQNANWRIMRSHHPLFNIGNEDKTGVWAMNFMYNGQNYGKLIDYIYKANIHFFIGSHYHVAYVLGLPYYDLILKNANFSLPVNPNTITTGCYDNFGMLNNSAYTVNTTCPTTQMNYTIQVNSKNPENYWEIVVGTSGKSQDPLVDDSQTRGVEIWGRGNGNFGGYIMDFSSSTCFVTYFELQNNTAVSTINGTADNSQFFLFSPLNLTIQQVSNYSNYTGMNSKFVSKFSNVTFPYTSYNSSEYLNNRNTLILMLIFYFILNFLF